jgi:hypothetical protein
MNILDLLAAMNIETGFPLVEDAANAIGSDMASCISKS